MTIREGLVEELAAEITVVDPKRYQALSDVHDMREFARHIHDFHGDLCGEISQYQERGAGTPTAVRYRLLRIAAAAIAGILLIESKGSASV